MAITTPGETAGGTPDADTAGAPASWRRPLPVHEVRDSAGSHRHDRRHAERRADVRTLRAERRDGQRQPRGAAPMRTCTPVMMTPRCLPTLPARPPMMSSRRSPGDGTNRPIDRRCWPHTPTPAALVGLGL